MEVERILPNVYDSELAYLGSVIIDPGVLAETADSLQPESFYKHENRIIYQAMLNLHEASQPIDYITLTNRLNELGKLDLVGGDGFIIGLINVVPTSIHAAAYARQITAAHNRRKLITLGSSIANLAFDETLSEEQICEQVDALYYSLNGNGSHQTLKSVKDIAVEHMAEVEARGDDWQPGIPTGLIDLDRVLGGLKPEKYYIIAGRPGMGKTALSDTISVHAAKNNHRVGWIDLEMGHSGKFVRFVSNVGRINTRTVDEMRPTSPEYTSYLQAAGQVSEFPIYVESISSLTAATLRRKVDHLQRQFGIEVVFIDYLQLMEDDGKGGNRERELATISRTIKGIAKDFQIPVVALVQLNRNVENRAIKRPTKADLSGSGSLEQDADVVMLLYRDDYYKPETTERPNIVEINVDKHRGGATGVVDVYWDGPSARFANLHRVEIDLPRLHVNGKGRAADPVLRYAGDEDE